MQPLIQRRLYPIDYQNYILVVPFLMRAQSTILKSILEFPLLNVWAITIGIFMICRKLVRIILKARKTYLFELFINTFGLSFGTTFPTNVTSRSETILVLFLSVFSIVANNLCSGYLFQQLSTSTNLPAINSLADLNDFMHIDVYIPTFFSNETEKWLRDRLKTFIVCNKEKV